MLLVYMCTITPYTSYLYLKKILLKKCLLNASKLFICLTLVHLFSVSYYLLFPLIIYCFDHHVPSENRLLSFFLISLSPLFFSPLFSSLPLSLCRGCVGVGVGAHVYAHKSQCIISCTMQVPISVLYHIHTMMKLADSLS